MEPRADANAPVVATRMAPETARGSLRVLTLCYEFPPIGGGGAKVAHGLAAELVRQGHTVELVTMAYRDLPLEEEVDGIRVHRVRCRRRKPFRCTVGEAWSYLAPARRRAGELLAGGDFDLVHAHFAMPDGWVARKIARRAGLEYVVTVHGSDVPDYNPYRLKLAHRLLAPLSRGILRASARVVCPSRFLEQLTLRHEPRAPTVRIPNGLDLARLTAGASKGRRILAVSRMLERKGLQYVLKAFGGMEADWELHIAGDGPFLSELQAMPEASDPRVRFWGWIDNDSPRLKELYQEASIFVFPSEAENFPIVLLEAMAGGLAIVTSGSTGCAEVVGDAALLVEPRDTAGIRNALQRLIGEPALREELGRSARSRLEEHFSWPAVARRYAEVYRQVAVKAHAG